MRIQNLIWLGASAAAMLACGCAQQVSSGGRFSDDAAFVGQHTSALVLCDRAGTGRVLVAPEYQGRVLTSTADGADGRSFGWINRSMIGSDKIRPHFNPYGGEDRFWIGPEGGQFSVFFSADSPFDLDHWYVPAAVDTEPFELMAHDQGRAVFRKTASLVNFSGTKFNIVITRQVQVLEPDNVWHDLGIDPPAGVKMVAFETDNRITNLDESWSKQTGLLSIWIMGMFTASPASTVVIPIQAGADLGPEVNDAYFGKPSADRLVVKNNVVYFKADAHFRSKIGIPPRRAKPLLGSYDAANQVLTLIQFSLPGDTTDYVNSQWKMQSDPFGGDVANSYNDGPSGPGNAQMGNFYELESSSPAVELRTGQTIEHTQRTMHLQGSQSDLDPIARATLGVSLEEIKSALPPSH